jgi:hypothetical protein
MPFKNGTLIGLNKRATFAIMALVLAPFSLAADIHVQPNLLHSGNRASAPLHISVNVVPIVQASRIAAAPAQRRAITYILEPAPVEQTYEIRSLPQDNTAEGVGRKNPAILKTLVVIPPLIAFSQIRLSGG